VIITDAKDSCYLTIFVTIQVQGDKGAVHLPELADDPLQMPAVLVRFTWMRDRYIYFLQGFFILDGGNFPFLGKNGI